MHYWARTLGMSHAEYHLLTVGEIEDLVLCNNIASGGMREIPTFKGIPDVR